MDNVITFTFGDLLIGVLLIAALIAIVLVIILIIRLLKTVGKVNKIIDENEHAFTKTMQKLPELTENASGTFKNTQLITETASEVVADVSDLADSFVSPEGPAGVITQVASAVISVVQVIRELIQKDQ